MANAQRGKHSRCYHCDSQSDAEAQHQNGTQRKLLELKTKQQDRYGSGARNKPARQSEHDDLARGYVAIGEPARDVAGVGALVRIHVVAIFADLETVSVANLAEMNIVVMGVASMTETDPRLEIMRLRNLLQAFEIFALVDEGKRLP